MDRNVKLGGNFLLDSLIVLLMCVDQLSMSHQTDTKEINKKEICTGRFHSAKNKQMDKNSHVKPIISM